MPLYMNERTRRFEPRDFDYGSYIHDMAAQVGERIAEARHIRKVSQTEAASMIGVGQNTFSNYERGVNRMDFARLTELALKLQMKPESLMCGLLSGEIVADLLDDPRSSMLEPAYNGAWWPAGTPMPESAHIYSFTVYACSECLSLAVVKSAPERGRAIDVKTDHIRMIVPGGVDYAVIALERELAVDDAYLNDRGYDSELAAKTGVVLDCPHPPDAFWNGDQVSVPGVPDQAGNWNRDLVSVPAHGDNERRLGET